MKSEERTLNFMINGVTMRINVDDYILNTLKEDITSEDVTTNAVMPVDKQGKADLICKQDGIICGLDIFKRTFELLDDTSRFEANFKDGDEVHKGDLLGVIYGDIKAILSGERTALNYLQRMSGIATITKEYMKELEGYSTTLLDTRKTTPNMRPFEKYAVTVGGATNHRYNLSDGVLLKDNHIGAAGSITKAIQMAKAYAPFVRKIEIETETLEQVKEALEAGADIIMLDNMDNETMRKAVELIDGKAQTECSGNVTKERLKEIAEVGVDFVSCGALTHSAPIMDVSLKNLTPIE
jgi:nicotinate-nucleotide pyrophosphorylase (carboxylating)